MHQAKSSSIVSRGDTTLPIDSGRAILAGENATIWTLWLTYGAFYFCRTNISAAVPGLKASIADGGLALASHEIGWILASLKIAYGIGQLVNGQLSERVSPRVMLAIGMFGSAALNVLFGFSTGVYFLLFVWAANGFCQSLGWTPTVRVTVNWIPGRRRGRAIGIIGTGYQFTLGLTYIIAGIAAEWLGWRGALYIPAILLAAAGIFMLVFLRESPPEASESLDGQPSDTAPSAMRLTLHECLYATLYNPALWMLGLALGLLNACRYGFLDWGITHLMETRDLGIGAAGMQFFVIAIGAIAGSYLTGLATDRLFGGRRAPMISLLMALLGILTLVYHGATEQSAIGSMLLLVAIGFTIFGPQVLLVGTAPADLAHRGAAGAAAGFVNFMGYLGAASGDVVTGYFSASDNGGWQVAVYIWAGWAFAGSLLTACMWNMTEHKVGFIPPKLPKIGAILSLAVAGTLVTFGGEARMLQIATYCATVVIFGSFLSRWVALPAGVVAASGILVVFWSYVEQQNGIRWDQTAAIVAYGFSAIAALMILVEKKDALCVSS